MYEAKTTIELPAVLGDDGHPITPADPENPTGDELPKILRPGDEISNGDLEARQSKDSIAALVKQNALSKK